jgi:opacity protein-like surface antigen
MSLGKEMKMRKYLVSAAIAAIALSSPAVARDNSGYVGVEAGLWLPRDQDADVNVFYDTVNAPGGIAGTPAGPSDFSFNNAFGLDYKKGYDIGAFGGYDFGMFRVEGEIGWKHANNDKFEVDSTFVNTLNADLNRPSTAPDPGAPGLPAISDSDVSLDESIGVLSFMLNGLLDFGDQDGFSFQAGGGVGWARAKLFSDKDSAVAWQGILGASYALSPNIDIGLRYRYFVTGSLKFQDLGAIGLQGNPNSLTFTPTGGTAPVTVIQTSTAGIDFDFESKVRSHSLLLTLAYNFGGVEAPPPPPPPPPSPPPPPPPATQTCPDGSVILATDTCPAPPPPPPPPPPAPERG